MTHRIRYMAAAAAFGIAALPGLASAQAQPAPAAKDIVTVAVEAGSFETLVAAVKAAGLVETLQGPGPFTVFAPTDAAFAELNLNASNIGSLPVETLTGILLYHVAPARRDAANVTSATSITMVSGGSAGISVTAAGAFIDGAQIVQTDVAAQNGIVHVIDAVLMP